jgi:hypothetical protein
MRTSVKLAGLQAEVCPGTSRMRNRTANLSTVTLGAAVISVIYISTIYLTTLTVAQVI